MSIASTRCVVRERVAQHVEVAAVAPDAVNADDDARIAGFAPLVVDDAMESVRRQALEFASGEASGGERHRMRLVRGEVGWIVGDRRRFVNRAGAIPTRMRTPRRRLCGDS
jgi:hypothetical protein